jgi:hypothetical protein
MGWRFRRSLKLGPVKLNFSKSGIGVSAGVRGFRVGTDAKGRTYTAVSIPGTGLYNRAYYGASKPIAQNTVSLRGAPPRQSAGTGLKLFIAFIAGGVVFSILGIMMSSPHASPPVLPPATLATPLVPPAAAPVKRHTHGSKRAKDPGPPHRAATKASREPQAPLVPASDTPPPS